MIGETLGQYRVTGVIGAGGMGVVYAAEHTLLGRPAAIKVLLPELSESQPDVARFFNEARAATAIRHPGIVEIYDFGWTGAGAAFLVMERLEGETLAQRTLRAQLPWSSVLALARQIAGALLAAHAKGIVHRDIKPENVFVIPDPDMPGGERIKLLDFGIAKLAPESTSMPSVTRTGALLGTPTYMSPEQCRGVPVDHRADLYALGCVMYELCCGRPPFVGEAPGDVLAAHIHLPVPAMSGAAPPAVEQLIGRLLAKAPGDRVQSAHELIQHIDAVAAGATLSALVPPRAAMAGVSSTTTLSGSASSMQATQTARPPWRLAAFALGLGAVTAGIVAVAMTRGGGKLTSRAAPRTARAGAPPQVPPVGSRPRPSP